MGARLSGSIIAGIECGGVLQEKSFAVVVRNPRTSAQSNCLRTEQDPAIVDDFLAPTMPWLQEITLSLLEHSTAAGLNDCFQEIGEN